MPYIIKEKRELLEPFLNDLFSCFSEEDLTPGDLNYIITPGDLNYIITRLSHFYLEKHGLSYTSCNDVLGVLNAANQEFYRRVVSPYEDLKVSQNGDVLPDYRGEEI